MLRSKGWVEDDTLTIPSGDSSTSSFHSERMPFLSEKSTITGRVVDLAYALTFLMTESVMGYGVNARCLTFFLLLS
jgi:hypothetical protein